MKRLSLCLALLLSGLNATFAGQPAQSLTVDFSGTYAPEIRAFQANACVFDVTLKTAGSAQDLVGGTPFMWWATNGTATSISTASVSVTSATSGLFRATFAPSAVNYTAGRYLYGVGWTGSNGVQTARTGTFQIQADPAASGASPVVWTTNVTISTCNWVGQFPVGAMPSTVVTRPEGSLHAKILTTTMPAYGESGSVAIGVTANKIVGYTGLLIGNDGIITAPNLLTGGHKWGANLSSGGNIDFGLEEESSTCVTSVVNFVVWYVD